MNPKIGINILINKFDLPTLFESTKYGRNVSSKNPDEYAPLEIIPERRYLSTVFVIFPIHSSMTSGQISNRVWYRTMEFGIYLGFRLIDYFVVEITFVSQSGITSSK
ncbi:hypothetical protein ACJX0J_020887, partial [Zea mays]